MNRKSAYIRNLVYDNIQTKLAYTAQKNISIGNGQLR